MSPDAFVLLLDGTKVTLLLSFAAALASLAIALPVGLALALGPAPLRAGLTVYVEIFRGTSLIVQLFWLYFVLPQFGLLMSEFTVAILAIALNYGAYGAVIVRSAIQSVPRAQWEASKALALPRMTALRLIIVPQAAMIMIRPFGTLFIQLIKATSLVSFITVADLTYRAYQIHQLSMDTVGVFGTVLIIYFVLTKTIGTLTSMLDEHASRWRSMGGKA